MEKNERSIRIRVMLDEKTYTDFSIFNAFNVHKSLKQPIYFMIIMLIFSIICFVSGRPQSALFGAALLIAGLALPVYYVLRFNASTRASIKEHGLPREAYELLLTDDTVEIQSLAMGGNSVTLKWSELYHAYRNESCIYLYALPQRAFLLPDDQADNACPDEVWNWITARLDATKANDVRKASVQSRATA